MEDGGDFVAHCWIFSTPDALSTVCFYDCCLLQFVSFGRRDVQSEEDTSINCLMALCVPVCVSVYSSVLHINQHVREVSERIHRDMRRETC